MARSFYKVNQSLRADRGILPLFVLLASVALIAVWLAWAFLARVTRLEVSDSARLEVAGSASILQASITGKVRQSHLILGQPIRAGRVLVELDDTEQQLALRQERTHRAELQPQLAALRAQGQSEDAGGTQEQRVLSVATEGAQAQYRDALAQAELAAQEASRASKLRAAGLIPVADAERAQAAAESKRAAADSLRLAVQRLAPELAVRNTDRDVRQKQLLAEIAKLEAEMAESEAAISRLAYEVDRRRIVAPLAGTLTECATLRPGALVTAGQQLGVILPGGAVQVVADFNPAAALGKLHPGQDAVVRLNGFPWAQFGLLHARVSRVAGEIRDGKVRVELALNEAAPKIPLQHGLPGSVEVEVERVSPAALVLRSAGQAMGAH